MHYVPKSVPTNAPRTSAEPRQEKFVTYSLESSGDSQTVVLDTFWNQYVQERLRHFARDTKIRR